MTRWFRLPWRRRADAPADVACNELVELVTNYLEGALSPEDTARFEAHIEMCEGCRMYVDQLRDTLTLLGELTPESLSPQAQRDLTAAFRDWKAQRS